MAASKEPIKKIYKDTEPVKDLLSEMIDEEPKTVGEMKRKLSKNKRGVEEMVWDIYEDMREMERRMNHATEDSLEVSAGTKKEEKKEKRATSGWSVVTESITDPMSCPLRWTQPRRHIKTAS